MDMIADMDSGLLASLGPGMTNARARAHSRCIINPLARLPHSASQPPPRIAHTTWTKMPHMRPHHAKLTHKHHCQEKLNLSTAQYGQTVLLQRGGHAASNSVRQCGCAWRVIVLRWRRSVARGQIMGADARPVFRPWKSICLFLSVLCAAMFASE